MQFVIDSDMHRLIGASMLDAMLLTHAVQQLASLLSDGNELLVHHVDALGA